MTTYNSIADLMNAMNGPQSGTQGYMGSLFDNPDYRRQRAFDTLGNIGAALIKASGPSLVPTNFGSVFAQGLAGAGEGQAASEDKYLRRLLASSQIAKNESEMARDKEWGDLFKTPAAAATATAATPPSAMPGTGNAGQAIAGIESGGRYDAVGPVANQQGNRAYGKYQVLDTNIGPWTQEVLGKAMTPQEFLASPQAQDAVFKAKFGQYEKQFGSPEAASRAWFAGPGGMNKPGATDVNGTTVQGYGQRFAQAYGPGATGPQVAQGDSVPAGDGSGNPVQTVQYQPPQAARPQTIQDVIATMPEGVRKMVAAMPRKDGMAIVMKYADPGSESVIDTTTGQVVFVPKTLVGRDPRYQPVEGAKLEIQRQQLANDTSRTRSQNANQPLTPESLPNRPFIEAQGAVEAAKAKAAADAKLTSEAALGLTQARVKDFEENQRPKAQAASQELTSLYQARQLLDAGVTAGPGSGLRNWMQQVASSFGFSSDQATNTPAFNAALAERILGSIKQLGANPSNADREYLEKAKGSSEMSPDAIRRMLEIGEKYTRRAIDSYDTESKRVMNMKGVKEAFGEDHFTVARPPSFDEWSKANPLQKIAPAGAPVAPSAPSGVRKYNPATGRIE